MKYHDLCFINNVCVTRKSNNFCFLPPFSCDFCVGSKFMCSQVIAPIKNEAGEVCMYILNFEDCDALPDAPNSAEHSTTVRFSKCNCIFSPINRVVFVFHLCFLYARFCSVSTFNLIATHIISSTGLSSHFSSHYQIGNSSISCLFLKVVFSKECGFALLNLNTTMHGLNTIIETESFREIADSRTNSLKRSLSFLSLVRLF